MRKQPLKSFVSDLLLGLGFVFIISPAILFWFIHGNNDRYIWIINGPYPFSHFGGGPFQLFVSVGLFIIGIGVIGISMLLKKRS
ncbi:MAG: hypothetical protein PHE29_05540 [Tissierellia bacterium]|nr:hypothetical protein [Tissierellia bacterium]